jgi:hypothetical protein
MVVPVNRGPAVAGLKAAQIRLEKGVCRPVSRLSERLSSAQLRAVNDKRLVAEALDLIPSWPIPINRLEEFIGAPLVRQDALDMSGYFLTYKSGAAFIREVAVAHTNAGAQSYTVIDFDEQRVVNGACVSNDEVGRRLANKGWQKTGSTRDYGVFRDNFRKGDLQLFVDLEGVTEESRFCVKTLSVGRFGFGASLGPERSTPTAIGWTWQRPTDLEMASIGAVKAADYGGTRKN